MAFKGLASEKVVAIILIVIVLVVIVYLVVSYFLQGKADLFGGKCKSIMLNACSSCLNSITGSGNSCSTSCNIQYGSISQSDSVSCIAELQNNGINMQNDGGFSGVECKKVGINCTS